MLAVYAASETNNRRILNKFLPPYNHCAIFIHNRKYLNVILFLFKIDYFWENLIFLIRIVKKFAVVVVSL